MTDINDKIKASLEKVRPSLQADGGDIELIGFDADQGIAQVRFSGMCVGCPMAQYTLNEGVAAQVMGDVPEVKKVVSI